MNNQLKAPWPSISEATSEASDGIVAIWGHSLNTTKGYSKGSQLCFIAFVPEKMKFYGELLVLDGQPAKLRSLSILPPQRFVDG